MALRRPSGLVLVHRRVYIVPARLGWMFGATLVLLLVGSINYAIALGFALTFLLAGLGLAGMVHTARNLARIGVAQGAPTGFAGEAAQFRIYLDGRARTTARRSSYATSARARSWWSTCPPPARPKWCSPCRRRAAAGCRWDA